MTFASKRLSRVKRVFDPYFDRRNFVRLDRNEDPVGWEGSHFRGLLDSIEPYDVSAYSDSSEFVKRVASWCGCQEDSVYVTAGSDAAIKNIFETYVDPGDKVIVQRPCWRMYDVYADIYQANLVPVAYNSELQLDLRAIADLIQGAKARIVILANPNQPTGTQISLSDLEEITNIAAQCGTLVVLDEAYFLFSHVTMARSISRFENLIVVRTLSKAFSLAGLRIGYCLANKDRIAELKLLRPVTDANSLALKFGCYALDHIDWIERRVEDQVAGRNFLYQSLVSAGLSTYPSYANFILVRYDNMEQGRKIVQALKRLGYLIKGPFDFAPLQNCIRISIGPLELMQRFWRDCSQVFVSVS